MFTTKQIDNLKLPEGKNKDLETSEGEEGLYVLLKRNKKGTSKYFIYRFTFENKQQELQFGAYPRISLAEARHHRQEAFELLKKGINPKDAKKHIKIQKQEAKENTFRCIAEKWYHVWQVGKADKTKRNHLSRLSNHIYPLFENTLITDIKRSDIVKLVEVLNEKNITSEAMKIIQTVKMVFDYAVSLDIVEFNVVTVINTSTLLKEHIPNKHPSIKATEAVLFFKSFLERKNEELTTRYALLLMAITAMRNQALRLSKWEHIDFEAKIWNFPPENMKGKISLKRIKDDIRIPLSEWAIKLLEELKASSNSEYIFPKSKKGGGKGEILSEAAVGRMIKAMGYDGNHTGKSEATPHGFRTLMKDVCMDNGYSKELVEAALAHELKGLDKSYQTTDLLELRRNMMDFYSGWLYEKYKQAEQELIEEQIEHLKQQQTAL